jgi:hypothetical protein
VLKDYYAILEVSPTASQTEIKRAFRKLAQAFHPDRNPSPGAEAVFKELNEAYQVLGVPEARQAYDERRLLPVRPVHRDPAMRRRPPGYRPRPGGPSETFLAMQASLPYLTRVFHVGIAVSALLFIDLLLPARTERHRLVQTRPETRFSAGPVVLVTETGARYPIARDDLAYFEDETEIEVRASGMLSILISLKNLSQPYVATNLASLYRNYAFAPVLLLLISALGLLYRKGVELRFNTAITAIVILLLTVFFYFQSVV